MRMKLHFQLQHLFQLVTVVATVAVAYTWHQEHQDLMQQNQDLIAEMNSSSKAIAAIDTTLEQIGIEAFFSPLPPYALDAGAASEAGWIHNPASTQVGMGW